MSITLDLPGEDERRLREHASRLGVSVQSYLMSLAGRDDRVERPRPISGAEALAYWQSEGCLGLFPDGPDSPELAREWREAEEAARKSLREGSGC
jgi:hypothetical protein